jgi:hypothetical protein
MRTLMHLLLVPITEPFVEDLTFCTVNIQIVAELWSVTPCSLVRGMSTNVSVEDVESIHSFSLMSEEGRCVCFWQQRASNYQATRCHSPEIVLWYRVKCLRYSRSVPHQQRTALFRPFPRPSQRKKRHARTVRGIEAETVQLEGSSSQRASSFCLCPVATNCVLCR